MHPDNRAQEPRSKGGPLVKYDIIVCGVGGQGILSVAAVIADAAMKAGLEVRQSEVHGMAQRGGPVQAQLRISDTAIHGDLIGHGRADLILAMDPLESLRYVEYLNKRGMVISAAEPFRNIEDYPDETAVLDAIRALPRHRLVQTKRLAEEAGIPGGANMVLVGAASSELPLPLERIQEALESRLASKGQSIVEKNLAALQAGRSGSLA